MKTFGIDISHWQGDFDFAKAKAEGVKYVIIKAGGGDAGLYKDSKFEQNYKNAKAAGLGVGAYFFGNAATTAEAESEARYFASILQGKQYDYPVFYDVESDRMNVGKDKLTEIVKTFCNFMENAGYWCGFYTNWDWYLYKLNGAALAARYSLWFAYWGTELPTSVSGVQMWQFGGETNYIRTNKVAGVVCDQDYSLVDYPSMIKSRSKNGYKATATSSTTTTKPSTTTTTKKPSSTTKKPTTSTKKKSVDEIAKEVIQGKWGVYPERKKKLEAAGYNYNEVQKRVDEMLK